MFRERKDSDLHMGANCGGIIRASFQLNIFDGRIFRAGHFLLSQPSRFQLLRHTRYTTLLLRCESLRNSSEVTYYFVRTVVRRKRESTAVFQARKRTHVHTARKRYFSMELKILKSWRKSAYTRAIRNI